MATVRTARSMAAATSPTRDRTVDLLRAAAILLVVVGHWLAVVPEARGDGRLAGANLLELQPRTAALTWLFQVLPVVFLVGGFANAASWTSASAAGRTAVGWVGERAARLLAPTTVFVGSVVAAAVTARGLGADPAVVGLAAWLVGIPLWFLAVYLAVVALTPLTVALHRRWGWRAPAATVALVAAADATRLLGAAPPVGAVTYLLGWLLFAQVGHVWQDDTLLRSPWAPRVLAGGGLLATALLVAGPYPLSMVGVPGEAVQNTAPPSLALLAFGTAQAGLVLLLARPMARWAHRPRVWTATVAVNGVVMSLYLWHMVPVVLLASVLAAAGALPQPEAGGGQWWLLRVPWLLLLATLLVAVLAVVGRAERPRPARRRAPAGPAGPAGPAAGEPREPGSAGEPGEPRSAGEPREPRSAGEPGSAGASRVVATPGRGPSLDLALLVGGTLLVCLALVRLTIGGLSPAAAPAGIPVVALAAYGAGLVALRLAVRGAPAPAGAAR